MNTMYKIKVFKPSGIEDGAVGGGGGGGGGLKTFILYIVFSPCIFTVCSKAIFL